MLYRDVCFGGFTKASAPHPHGPHSTLLSSLERGRGVSVSIVGATALIAHPRAATAIPSTHLRARTMAATSETRTTRLAETRADGAAAGEGAGEEAFWGALTAQMAATAAAAGRAVQGGVA